MEEAPLKSQSLHNFSLSFLKWGNKNHVNSSHRFRRPTEAVARSSPSSVEEQHQPELETENRGISAGSRTAGNRFSFASCSSRKQQSVVSGTGIDGGDVAGEEGEAKVYGEVEGDEPVAKPWNLRPRKVATGIGASSWSKNGEFHETISAIAPPQSESLPKSMRLRGALEGQVSERAAEKRRKLWISLSREEIEEDVYALTGSRPARRPKKRPKTVQKQLDSIFPCLYLVGLSADSYRIPDAML